MRIVRGAGAIETARKLTRAHNRSNARAGADAPASLIECAARHCAPACAGRLTLTEACESNSARDVSLASATARGFSRERQVDASYRERKPREAQNGTLKKNGKVGSGPLRDADGYPRLYRTGSIDEPNNGKETDNGKQEDNRGMVD